MADALAEPAGRGSLDEIEHVVILMQENRSFDHYYGTMSGRARLRRPRARAAAAERPIDVFHQPAASRTDGGCLLPFHVDTAKVDGAGSRRSGPQLDRHALRVRRRPVQPVDRGEVPDDDGLLHPRPS